LRTFAALDPGSPPEPALDLIGGGDDSLWSQTCQVSKTWQV